VVADSESDESPRQPYGTRSATRRQAAEESAPTTPERPYGTRSATRSSLGATTGRAASATKVVQVEEDDDDDQDVVSTATRRGRPRKYPVPLPDSQPSTPSKSGRPVREGSSAKRTRH